MNEYIDLFIIFARIGATTFGGGYAMLPILQKEIVENRGFATEEEIMDYYAISQCTPGIIAVNTAIFIGYKCKKEIGAIVSALGMVFPSVVVILMIAMFLNNIMTFPVVQLAFKGVRIAVGALVLNATVNLFKKGVIDIATLIIFIIVFVVLMFTSISPIPVVLGSAIFGVVLKVKKRDDAK
ncbi:MAG: chromate transporter [Clostridiales bacterium]|nr:chromate transporter [Clostridiales bacterium]